MMRNYSVVRLMPNPLEYPEPWPTSLAPFLWLRRLVTPKPEPAMIPSEDELCDDDLLAFVQNVEARLADEPECAPTVQE